LLRASKAASKSFSLRFMPRFKHRVPIWLGSNELVPGTTQIEKTKLIKE
jgi:hypothetical protein